MGAATMSKIRSRSKSRHRHRRAGTAMILMLFLMIGVFGMVALSVDLGLMVLLRAEIQSAVDAGALAAGLKLQSDRDNVLEAEESARSYVQLNHVGMGSLVPEDAIEIESGRFDNDSKTFVPTHVSPNAVRVFARQDGEPFFFGKLFGHDTFGAPASAIASGTFTKLDIVMVLDLSGSMASEGRIEALQHAAPTFVTVIEESKGDDQIAVMGLAADPTRYDPANRGHSGRLYRSGLHPTPDHYVGVLEAGLTKSLQSLRSRLIHTKMLEAGKYTGWTGTGAAIGDATHLLHHSPHACDSAEKFIVLMSDGRANKPSGHGASYARSMARYAANHEVTIYSISLGNGADLGLMQDIAELTDGEHFDATGTGQAELTERLTKAFKDVGAALKRVQLVK
ncbi:MAG: TadG family pilus assembly protein [bacterium]